MELAYKDQEHHKTQQMLLPENGGAQETEFETDLPADFLVHSLSFW